MGALAILAAVSLVSLLCDFATEDGLELERTNGMVETTGEFDVERRGTVEYRIFRHPEQIPNARIGLLLKRAVADTERYLEAAFPAKTVVLIFDDTEISEDRLGQLRLLPGAGFFAPISHGLSARWIQMEVRTDQESDTDSLRTVLTHEVAHYYWHHQPDVDAQEDFFLDEGAAHYLEYKLGDNDEIGTSARLAGICIQIDPQKGPTQSHLRDVALALDLDVADSGMTQLLTNREFAESISQLCSDKELTGRYRAAGVFIEAEELMGSTKFRRAFREIWEASKDTAQDASDVYDVLCIHAATRKCEGIEEAFEEYGFEP